jgi:hypothetical protein
MSAETSPKLRGTIVKVPDATPGLLFVAGQQKSFTMEGVWKSPVAPAANQIVDVDMDGAGVITGVAVVDAQQMNRERVGQMAGVAGEKGKEAAKEAAKMAQQGVGALAARMGKVALGALVALWIVWFLLPAYSIGIPGIASQSFTFWQYLGFDMSGGGLAGPTSSTGFLGLLGVVVLLAPIAAPFIKDPRAKFLNAAPLAFILLAMAYMHFSISHAAGGFGADVSDMVSMSWGLYLLILLGLVLAAQAVMKPSVA